MPSEKSTALLRTMRRLVRPDLKGWTDTQLLEHFSETRSEIAFAALMRRHGPLVLSVSRRYLGNLHDAEDVYQATFLVLAQKAGRLRRRGGLGSWLYGVAYRLAMKARTRATRRRALERRAAEMTRPHTESGLGELQMILDEELQCLAEKYRAPFVLCCLENKSRLEVAKELGLAEGTVASRLDRARKQLQKRLTRRGITLVAVLTANGVSSAVAGVPSKLAEGTLNAALSYVAGSSVNVSVGALALAQAAILGKIKMVFMALTAAVLALAGAGWAGYKANSGQIPMESTKSKQEAQTKKPERRDLAGGLRSMKQPRVDAYGVPLPEGAVARLGTRQFRHEHKVTLAYTPDGKALVGLTASGILVWEAATGIEQLRHRVGTYGYHLAMAISPDVQSVAVAGHDSGITLWGLQSGQKIRTLPLPDGDRMGHRPLRLGFTPDGKLLAASYTDEGRSLVFDVGTGEIRTTLGGKDDSCCFGLALSPDGKTMAAAVGDSATPLMAAKHQVHLLETATGKLIRVLHNSQPGESGSTPLAFSPDGKSLACSVNKTIFVYETATGKTQASFDARSYPFELMVTPDGTRLAWNDYQGQVRVWDLAAKKIVHVLDSRFGYGSSLAISPDGKTIALGGSAATPRLWELGTGKELFTENQGHDSCISDQAFSPDGKTLVTTGHRQTFLWDTSTWKMSGTLPWGAQTVSFSPDGKRLAAIDVQSGRPYASTVRVLDMATGKDVRKIAGPEIEDVESVRYSADGRTIYTLDFWPKGTRHKAFIRHWDADTGRQTKRLPIPVAFTTLAPNGTVFAALTLNSGGNVMMFDLGVGRKRFIGPANGELSYRPALSPDSRHVAFGFAKRKGTWWENVKDTRVCEVASGKEVLVLKGHQSDNITCAWSPDGRILATGTTQVAFGGPAPEQTIRLWDTATGRELKTYDGINADAAVLTFAPNGKTLVAGLRDGTVLVFDVSQFNPRLESAPLADDELQACWTDLAGNDAVQANKSAWRLADAAARSVPFLRERLKPAPAADPAKVQRWIADLDSEKFAIRQAVAQQLEKLDGQVQEALQKALKGSVSLESRRRLEQILDRQFHTPSRETVRLVRAVMVLERIGRLEAKKVLQTLAKGAPGARETEEAKASLERLKARVMQ